MLRQSSSGEDLFVCAKNKNKNSISTYFSLSVTRLFLSVFLRHINPYRVILCP